MEEKHGRAREEKEQLDGSVSVFKC